MSKGPMIMSIVGVCITIIPFLGPLAGLALSIVGFIGGSKQLNQARLDPAHAGIGIAHTAKWMGLGGMIQNALALLHLLFVLIMVAAS